MNCSICCLIYQSPTWLDFVYQQLVKYTNLTENEFFFIANHPTPAIINHLEQTKLPYYRLNHSPEQQQEWFINNVYRGYNYGATKAKGEFLVFINSDMAFSPMWLENLVKHYQGSHCITSRLVESGRLPSGQHCLEQNFGSNPSDYDETKFLEFAAAISNNISKQGGLYMPLLAKKSDFLAVGGYPEGNITPDSDLFQPHYAKPGEPCLTGDLILMKKLATRGIQHFTAFDSIVYHFQRGESDFPDC